MTEFKLKVLPLVLASVMAPTIVQALEDNTDTLPNAKPGECYAKVMVPAQYRDETTTVVVKEAAEKVTVVPAKYEVATEQVQVTAASKKLVPVAAVWGSEKETVEISPARTAWVANSLKSSIEVNPVVLSAAQKAGVNLNTAKAGVCYHEHYQPAKYETKTEKVLVSEAYQKLTAVPAKFENATERVLVRAASKKLVEVPAVYETIKEKVLVEPAKSEWKKGRGLVEKVDGSTGEIMCLVEVPAKYKVVEKRVIKKPASTNIIEIPAKYEDVPVRKLKSDWQQVRADVPAKYETITRKVKTADAEYIWHPVATPGEWGSKTGNVICKKQIPAKTKTLVKKVIKTPATFKTVEVPAVFKTKKVTKLVADAKETRAKIPEVTKQVTKRVKVSNAKLQWQSVLCETNMSQDVVRNVQSALNKAGFNAGTADGVIGRQTLLAIDAYQRKEGISSGGLTMETLNKLGISI